ncbi:MOSC domain-containing protein [Pelomonas sp. SE-A7]|uniref:MOSC domain-containing protein n=1 Tax=Pelomonas sp. SE-A7 TaxID=3054953 RepID=UPI00259CD503|nr:MOSC domain-containing protein [Pelomonas sp. SE-A7]MDM4768374.1 MOSC domain-containing protein [Pelomonas sp. SE-A7]
MSGGLRSLISLNTGSVQDLATPQGHVPSAIVKRPREGAVLAGELGLAGDEQADPRFHGGPAKAVYAYPSEHYPFWQTVRAQAGAAPWGQVLPWGSLGENLTLAGLVESQVWMGDRLVFPDCELVVSEPRQPCFKFNAVMGFDQAAKLMWQSGWCGFYLAVVKPGPLQAGQDFELVAGPRELGLAELFKSKAGRSSS